MRMNYVVGALAVFAAASSAQAAGFVNGGFEDGNLNGWTTGGGCRASVGNAAMSPTQFLAGGALAGVQGSCFGTGIGPITGHSEVISAGYVDPNVGALLGSTVYNGAHSVRVEDTTFGGFASVLSQTVVGYTDPQIAFAWKAVLLGAHGPDDAATFIINLRDLTTGTNLIRREYNAASGGSGVDARFSQSGGNFYTRAWQEETLAIDASLSGHTFQLTVLAADCQPTGHWGYVYLDGFGAVLPPPGAPEPGSLALAGVALAGLAAARRRKQA